MTPPFARIPVQEGGNVVIVAMSPRVLPKAVVLAALSLVIPAAERLRADETAKASDKEKSSQLARDLVGTWVLAGTPENPEEPPKSGGRLKFFTGKHWCITQSDAETGKVIFHHGGTYTLDGDEMAGTIEYANDNTASLIKKTHRFKIKVEGDTYTQVGLDNPFTEVWKRLK
jgi:hypothetical protein